MFGFVKRATAKRPWARYLLTAPFPTLVGVALVPMFLAALPWENLALNTAFTMTSIAGFCVYYWHVLLPHLDDTELDKCIEIQQELAETSTQNFGQDIENAVGSKTATHRIVLTALGVNSTLVLGAEILFILNLLSDDRNNPNECKRVIGNITGTTATLLGFAFASTLTARANYINREYSNAKDSRIVKQLATINQIKARLRYFEDRYEPISGSPSANTLNDNEDRKLCEPDQSDADPNEIQMSAMP